MKKLQDLCLIIIETSQMKLKIANDNGAINISIRNSKSFDYKSKIVGTLAANFLEKEVTIVIPLKYLGNFWKSLDIPLIHCEITLVLSWYKRMCISKRSS